MRAREHPAVVRVEVEPLVRIDQRLLAAVALEPFGATGHGSEDVVAVHGPKDQTGPVPRLGAATATNGLSTAALETAHADRRQELRATFDLHLGARGRVLPG